MPAILFDMNRSVSRLALACLTLFASPLTLASGDPRDGVAATQAGYEGAQARCARAAGITHEINLSSGVNNERVNVASPLRIAITTGTDAARYDSCLRREGFPPRRRMLATFERADACRDEARRPARVRLVDGTGSLAQPFDEAHYRDCLDGGIDVEVM